MDLKQEVISTQISFIDFFLCVEGVETGWCYRVGPLISYMKVLENEILNIISLPSSSLCFCDKKLIQIAAIVYSEIRMVEIAGAIFSWCLLIMAINDDFSLVAVVLREQEKNWPCYECNRRFISSEQLQQHLNSHDEKLDVFTR